MIEFHPLANIFPLIEGPEFDALVSDVREHGVLDQIVLLGKQILDGRNRYRAAVAAKVLPESLDHVTPSQLKSFRQFVPLHAPQPSQKELLDFVVSKNLHRRQLTDDQRRMVAARMVNLKAGRPAEDQLPQSAAISRETAAQMLTTDVAGVEWARSVLAHAAPAVVAMVDEGAVTVAAAAEIAKQPMERQAEIVASLPRDEAGKLTPEAKKALAPIIKEVRADKQAEKKLRRTQKEADLGRKLMAMPDKKYGVAIMDFEWDHEPYSRETGMDRHPSNHYPTAADAHTPEEIAARMAERVKCLADTCVLYFWTTIPHEAIAHEVVKLLGFLYVSQRVWNKTRPGAGRGPGYWVTGEHEILFICTRGKVVAPDTAHFPSKFDAPVGEHSAKPDQQYEHAEYHFPSLPKIELNARRSRPGWDAWGNEAPAEGAPASEAAE